MLHGETERITGKFVLPTEETMAAEQQRQLEILAEIRNPMLKAKAARGVGRPVAADGK